VSRPPSRPGDRRRSPRERGAGGKVYGERGGRPGGGRSKFRTERDEHPKEEREGPRSGGPEHERANYPRHAHPKPHRPRHEDRRPHWQRRDAVEDEDRILIWGIHAVDAALRNPRREVKRLLLTDNAAHRLAEALTTRPLAPQSVAPRDLDRELGPETVHQGAFLETAPLPEPSLGEILQSTPAPLLVVLDQVTDPHNVGAILRSAAAFGVAALIMTRRHSPPLGGALAKSASGALELVPVLHVANLARALAELGDNGVFRLGLDGAAEESIEDVIVPDSMPPVAIALVLGAEEHGLRRLSKDTCDRLVRLTTPGALASLNVSTAAAIAMHHIALARRRAGKESGAA
jgi:23S rRNA (guanosine2251-2'-O)-methyltransferase